MTAWNTTTSRLVINTGSEYKSVAFTDDVSALTGNVTYLQALTGAQNKIPYFDSATSMDTLGFIDDDTMSTADDDNVPSAESVKAYVDGKVGTGTIGSANLASGAVVTAKVGDAQITEPKLGISNAGSTGNYLRKTATGMEWAAVSGEGGGASDLDDLTDVRILNVANNDALIYNSTNSRFENRSRVTAPAVVNAAGSSGSVQFTGIPAGVNKITAVMEDWKQHDNSRNLMRPYIQVGTASAWLTGSGYKSAWGWISASIDGGQPDYVTARDEIGGAGRAAIYASAFETNVRAASMFVQMERFPGSQIKWFYTFSIICDLITSNGFVYYQHYSGHGKFSLAADLARIRFVVNGGTLSSATGTNNSINAARIAYE